MEARNTDSNTSLHLAAKNGHPNVVKLLLEQGAWVGAPDKDKNTALHLAVWKGHIVDPLLWKGASIPATGQHPLHLATFYGHTGAAELLLKKGASFGAKRKDGSMYSIASCRRPGLHWRSGATFRQRGFI